MSGTDNQDMLILANLQAYPVPWMGLGNPVCIGIDYGEQGRNIIHQIQPRPEDRRKRFHIIQGGKR